MNIVSLWILIERLFRYIPKLLFIAAYLLMIGYMLYILNYGLDRFVKEGFFYEPVESIKYVYRYFKWLWDTGNVFSWPTFMLLVAATIPLLATRIMTNLYYFLVLMTTSSIKGMGFGDMVSATRAMRTRGQHGFITTNKSKSGLWSRILGEKKTTTMSSRTTIPAGTSVTSGSVYSSQIQSKPLKEIATGIDFIRLDGDEARQQKIAKFQDSTLQGKRRVIGDDEKRSLPQ